MGLFSSNPVVLKRNINGKTTARSYFDDTSRVVFLSFIIIFTILGYFLDKNINSPSRHVRQSVQNALKQSFMASIEGETFINGYPVSEHRIRQTFYPGKNSETVNLLPEETGEPEQFDFNARTYLEKIVRAKNIKRISLESMYGKPVRRYSGSFEYSNGNEEGNVSFDYWIETGTKLPVRLSIKDHKIVENNSSKKIEIALTIRYFNWPVIEKK